LSPDDIQYRQEAHKDHDFRVAKLFASFRDLRFRVVTGSEPAMPWRLTDPQDAIHSE
jgi:hypothetical protein